MPGQVWSGTSTTTARFGKQDSDKFTRLAQLVTRVGKHHFKATTHTGQRRFEPFNTYCWYAKIKAGYTGHSHNAYTHLLLSFVPLISGTQK